MGNTDFASGSLGLMMTKANPVFILWLPELSIVALGNADQILKPLLQYLYHILEGRAPTLQEVILRCLLGYFLVDHSPRLLGQL